MNKQVYIKKAEDILGDTVYDGLLMSSGDVEKSFNKQKAMLDALYQLHLEGVREIVNTWGAIPSTDDYAQGWNDARKEFAKSLSELDS